MSLRVPKGASRSAKASTPFMALGEKPDVPVRQVGGADADAAEPAVLSSVTKARVSERTTSLCVWLTTRNPALEQLVTAKAPMRMPFAITWAAGIALGVLLCTRRREGV